MERYTTNTMTIERKGVFDKSRKKRFELTFICKDSKQKKHILVIGLNPASDDISKLDTTTTFILNNLIPMGYGTITICNLYGELFKQRLKPSEVPNNRENRKYLEEVLKRLRPFVFEKKETEEPEKPGNGKPSENVKESQKEEGEKKPNEECSTNQDYKPVVSAETA